MRLLIAFTQHLIRDQPDRYLDYLRGNDIVSKFYRLSEGEDYEVQTNQLLAFYIKRSLQAKFTKEGQQLWLLKSEAVIENKLQK